MGAIASLSLNLAVDTSDWSKGLRKAEDAVGKFAGSVASKTGGIAKSMAGMGSSMAGIGKAAAAGFGGFVKAAAGAAAGVAAGAAVVDLAAAAMTTAYNATVGAVAGGIERIDQLTDAAGRIGVTTEALSALRYAADLTGSSADDLDAALEKLNANLGDAAIKGNPAGEALAKIGLDAKELANDTPDVAFREIVHAFEQVPNAANKASLAMDIFGKGGMKLINTLGAGNSTIDELVEEANRLGVSVSQVDAAKIGVAKDAWDRMGMAIQGVGNQLAVTLSPIIEVAAKEMTGWLISATEKVGGVRTALVAVGKTIGYVADAYAVVGMVAARAFEHAARGAGTLVGFIDRELGKKLTDFADSFGEKIDQAFAKPPSERIGKFLSDIQDKADAAANEAAQAAREGLGQNSGIDGIGKGVADLTEKLKEQAATFGMTAAEADIYKLATQGATAEQLAGAWALAGQIKELEKTKKDRDDLESKAKDYAKAARTPDQQHAFESAEIDKARDAGLLTDEQATRAKAKSRKDAGLDEVKFAGAEDVRSSGGYSTIVAALSGRGTGMSELVKTNRESLKEEGRQTTILGKVFTALNGKKDPEVINI